MCELVAEIASCFTASEIGVPHGEGVENHASYVKSWLEQMKGDASFIFRASRMARQRRTFCSLSCGNRSDRGGVKSGEAPPGESPAGLV